MAKYYVDWNDVQPEEAGVLIDAVARYYSSTESPDASVVSAILGMEKIEAEKKGKEIGIVSKLISLRSRT